MTQLGPDQLAHVSVSAPSNWTDQFYNNNNNNQQFTPQYPGQQYYLQPFPNNIYWQNHDAVTRQMASATITQAQNSMDSNTSDRQIAYNATHGDDVHQLFEIPVVTHQALLTRPGSSQVPMETGNPTELSQNKKNRPKRSSAAAAQATQVLKENDLELDTEV